MRTLLVTAGISGSFLACGPGFFAQEARQPGNLAASLTEETAEVAPAPPPGAGLGCSPKGCLMDGIPEPQSALVAGQRATASGMAARPRPRPLLNHPLRGTSSAEIEQRVKTDLASLGPMSFGMATRGGLLNGVYLPDDARWVSVDPAHAWGTAETIDYLVSAIDVVHKEFPDSHPLFIGDISRKTGGYLTPHLSHQSGKDVDVSYFYTRDPEWYAKATASNLDRPRTWALIRAVISHTDVHFIFIDHRVQRLLRSYAEAIGEDRGWLESIFDGVPGEPAIIRHEPGHDTHLHLRFYNPVAEETARRCYAALLKHKKLLPMRYNITHKVKKGETLIGLAKKYGTTVATLMRANGLKKSMIQANKTYYIPRNGPAGPAPQEEVPARRLPPPRAPVTGPVASLAE